MTSVVAALALLAAAQAGAATELEAGYGHETLTRGLADWRTAWVEAVRTGERGGAVALSARGLERYGEDDLLLSAAVRAPAGAWAVTGEAGLGTARVLVPAWTAGAGVERALGHGRIASGAAKLSWWSRAGGGRAVGLGSASLEQYWGAFRLAGTAYAATVDGAFGGSARIAFDRFFRARDRLGVAIAFGREVESAGAGAVLVTPVLGLSVGGRTGIGGDVAITWELAVQRQGDRYTRAGATLGVRRRF